MEWSLLQSTSIFLSRIFKPLYLSCLFSWAARRSSCMFLVICSVFRMTSSVLGRRGLGAPWGSAVSGTEPSPCHTTLLCLPFLPDLRTLKKCSRAAALLLGAMACASAAAWAGCSCGFLYPVLQRTHGEAMSSTGSHSSRGGPFILPWGWKLWLPEKG